MEKIITTKKARRLKHGVTVFVVHAFQDRGQTPAAWVDEQFVTCRPYESEMTGALFFDYAHSPSKRIGWCYSTASLLDCHVIGQQTYNLHRLFFSRKKAESYAKLVRSGCDVSSMFPGARVDWDEAAADIDAGWYDMFDDGPYFGDRDAGFDPLDDLGV